MFVEMENQVRKFLFLKSTKSNSISTAGLLKISCFIDWINKITNHVESETTTTTEATITNSSISALDTDQSDGDDTGL